MALYNTFLYNEEQFNAFQLSELITLSESLTFAISVGLIDTIFSPDDIFKQVTNKGLSDTVRTADWISSEQNPQSDNWGN